MHVHKQAAHPAMAAATRPATPAELHGLYRAIAGKGFDLHHDMRDAKVSLADPRVAMIGFWKQGAGFDAALFEHTAHGWKYLGQGSSMAESKQASIKGSVLTSLAKAVEADTFPKRY